MKLLGVDSALLHEGTVCDRAADFVDGSGDDGDRMAKVAENSFLDSFRQRGWGKFPGIENHVSALDVGLHLLQSHRFEGHSKPVHLYSFVAADVDSAK